MDEEGVDAELEVRLLKQAQAFALQGMHNSHSSANLLTGKSMTLDAQIEVIRQKTFSANGRVGWQTASSE